MHGPRIVLKTRAEDNVSTKERTPLALYVLDDWLHETWIAQMHRLRIVRGHIFALRHLSIKRCCKPGRFTCSASNTLAVSEISRQHKTPVTFSKYSLLQRHVFAAQKQKQTAHICDALCNGARHCISIVSTTAPMYSARPANQMLSAAVSVEWKSFAQIAVWPCSNNNNHNEKMQCLTYD